MSAKPTGFAFEPLPKKHKLAKDIPSDEDSDSESSEESDGSISASDIDGEPSADPPRPQSDHPAVGSSRIPNGKLIKFREKPIGTITSWTRGISCKCRTHTACSLPALKHGECPSDSILVGWLLSAYNMEGEVVLGRDAHKALIPTFD